MARYQSIVAYDGTDYHGFQRQVEGLPTIQGVLEEALRRIGWQGDSLLAAGRTDAGVHARAQVIAFDHDWRHTIADLTAALNDQLPGDVAVTRSQLAADGFHPRFDASSRLYRYRILMSEVPDPLRARFVWRRWSDVDLAWMQEAATGFIGRHDFGAFGQAPIEDGHTVREIKTARWERVDDEHLFSIEADAFLQHMVRRLVAALVQIGEGREDAQKVLKFLDRPEQRWEGNLAPACGLILERVNYDRKHEITGNEIGSEAASVESKRSE
ncbi:MAG: tRNA pseudouridine(38-40) synthase TruA [Anaerolineales bacterium]